MTFPSISLELLLLEFSDWDAEKCETNVPREDEEVASDVVPSGSVEDSELLGL